MKNNQKHIDAAFINAYKQGDKNALTKLVKRWHLEFCKKAFWLVKDADLSKDIAQDCWQIIIHQLHNLENPSRFKSWAFRIVYSKSMDALRQKSRKRFKENELKQEQTVFHEEEDNSEIRARLLDAIGKLPVQQQIVLRLFYTQDYSLKEIAKMMNVSEGTVKSRLFHAREKLKTELIYKTRTQ